MRSESSRGLVGHPRDFASYSERDGEQFDGFKQGNVLFDR